MRDDCLRILGYRAPAPSGHPLYWCGECWMLLVGHADFLLPDDPAASTAVLPGDADAEHAYCMACYRHLLTGRCAPME
jgi:hypothetical protein